MIPEEMKEKEIDRSENEIDRLAFIGTLAEGLAHEIRNPLSTININLQLLKEDWEQPETEREQTSHERVQCLLNEIDHLEEILNHFLQFARGLDLQLEDLDINSFLDEFLDVLEPELDRENIELERSFEQGIPLVSIDRNKFRQCLVNIIKNAREAMADRQDGELRVWTRTSEDGSIRITIRDNGEGIPGENLENVFEVYFSTRQGGTGLGLPIARRIIEEHDGTIDVRSDGEEGTCVEISLPPARTERERNE